MKIRAINPGRVWNKTNSRGLIQGYGYCFVVTGDFGIKTTVDSMETFPSAADAKQAMREKVHQERKRHSLI